MRKVFMLIAAMVGILCFSTAVLAEGFTLDTDLTWTEPNQPGDYNVAFLTLDGQYDLDPFVLGGEAIISVYRDPAYEDPEEAFTYAIGIYGGYKVLEGDAFNLTGIAGYYMFKQTYTDGVVEIDWNTTSFVVGFKASADFDPFSVSLSYLYGVSPESTTDINVLAELESADAGFSILELKGTYALSDAWSIGLVYRDLSVIGINSSLTDGQDLGNSGFGVIVTRKF